MGKRLAKKELLAEMADERGKLVELLFSIPKKQYTIGGLNKARWSVKDVVAHLFDWEGRVLDWYEMGKRGVAPQLPDADFNWRETPALNEQIFRQHRRKSWSVVLASFESAHRRTQKLVKAMTDKELTTIGHYAWTGKSWTLSDFIRGNTSSHFRWARTKIAKWWRNRQSDLD